MHTHLVDQQILTRNGGEPYDYERGPKDVIYTGESEEVELIMKFGPNRGRYMIHCHNLPHEDHDMMVQFSVGIGPDEVDPHDPVGADPAKRDGDGDDGRSPDAWPPGCCGVRGTTTPAGSGSSGSGSGLRLWLYGRRSSSSGRPGGPPKKRKKPKKKPGKKGHDDKGHKGKGHDDNGHKHKGHKGKGPNKGKPRPPRGPRHA